MKSRTISTLIALSLAIPLGAYAINADTQANSTVSESNTSIIAQRPSEDSPRRGKKGRGQRWERMMKKLDLTPEQTEAIQNIKEKYRGENPNIKEEIRENKEKMHSLLANDASSNELRQQHQKMQSLRQQMGDRKFESMLEMREVLTPEQRTKMAQLIKERSKRAGFHSFH